MGKKIFLDKFIGDCSTWWINDQIMPLAREFHKRISSALKTVILKISPNYEGVYTWR